MLLLLAIPVIAGTAFAHRLLQVYAPSNVLIARMRASRPTFSGAFALAALALALLSVVHSLSVAIDRGAAGWINLAVVVLAWDAIKFGALAVATTARSVRDTVRRVARRGTSRTQLATRGSSTPEHLSLSG